MLVVDIKMGKRRSMTREQQKAMFANMNNPRQDGSGQGKRLNQGRGGCKATKTQGQGKKRIRIESYTVPSHYRNIK